MRSKEWSVCLGSAFALSLVATVSAGDDELGRRGRMGVNLAPVTPQVVEQLGLPAPEGIVVTNVVPGSAAERAGFQVNDVMVRVAGQPVTDIQSGFPLFRKNRAGREAEIGIIRDGKEMTIKITPDPWPMETSEDHDVIYDSAGPAGRRVRTLITTPKSPGKHPAVMFIPGLGPASMDFGAMPQHPYRRLLDGLTAKGFVTMRVERLGVGDSEGDSAFETTLQEDIASFSAALKKLKGYDYVDSENVFILGHSSGAMIAPVIADNVDVRGVITYAAIARPLMAWSSEQNERRWKFELREGEELAKTRKHVSTFMKECFVDGHTPEYVLDKHPELKDSPDVQVQPNGIVMGLHYKFWQSLAALDLPKLWSDVDTNVLAVWGASDWQAAKACSQVVVDSVNAHSPGKASMLAIEGIDHGFQPAEDREESFLMGPTGEFNDVIIEETAKWMRSRMKKTST